MQSHSRAHSCHSHWQAWHTSHAISGHFQLFSAYSRIFQVIIFFMQLAATSIHCLPFHQIVFLFHIFTANYKPFLAIIRLFQAIPSYCSAISGNIQLFFAISGNFHPVIFFSYYFCQFPAISVHF